MSVCQHCSCQFIAAFHLHYIIILINVNTQTTLQHTMYSSSLTCFYTSFFADPSYHNQFIPPEWEAGRRPSWPPPVLLGPLFDRAVSPDHLGGGAGRALRGGQDHQGYASHQVSVFSNWDFLPLVLRVQIECMQSTCSVFRHRFHQITCKLFSLFKVNCISTVMTVELHVVVLCKFGYISNNKINELWRYSKSNEWIKLCSINE